MPAPSGAARTVRPGARPSRLGRTGRWPEPTLDPMALVVLKLTITPLVVGGASMVARRWGPLLGGFLIALPLTSGPVLLFLALDHGAAFASGAAKGSLAGCIPIVGFAFAYALVAVRAPWPLALLAGIVGWAAPALVLAAAPDLALPLLVVLVVAVVAAAIRSLPRTDVIAPPASAPPWDVPFRIAVVTSLVVVLTAAAQALGPRARGILATVPAIAAALTVFSHQRDGASHAIGVLRGLLGGLLGTAAFHTVASAGLVPAGIPLAFVAAIAAALAVQGAALVALRRTPAEAVAQTADGLPAL